MTELVEPPPPVETICVVGAGPKAAAIAARAAVLGQQHRGLKVPQVLILERHQPGAAWSGGQGFSDGRLTLCTPGEKDVGYPYGDETRFGDDVGLRIFEKFSWSSFLVTRGYFSEWIERGRRFPSHRRWAEYIRWVIEQGGAKLEIANVQKAKWLPSVGWEITALNQNGKQKFRADALVLSGTGPTKTIPVAADVDAHRVLDAQNFWRETNLEALQNLTEGDIAVIGDGGSAGAIVAWLVEEFADKEVGIKCINRTASMFLRGDGYAERQYYSDPSDWTELNEDDRRRIIERTEAGVVSARNKAVIDAAENVAFVRGRATSITAGTEGVLIAVEYAGRACPPVEADYAVMAIGFDDWGLLELVDGSRQAGLISGGADMGAKRASLGRDFAYDLSLPASAGLGQHLHLPALAALARGPGFAGLGCLGLLASRILDDYVIRPPNPAG
jgi:mycobactin lysine-N-oxygenase